MATPYFQKRTERVPSTQDVARELLGDLPLLVIAAEQTKGRGRSGASWVTAERALAVSLAWHDHDDVRPLSLMAGLAAARAAPGTRLKWPNDVLVGGVKVGGILVERSGGVSVAGFGLNLWWPEPPDGIGSLCESDPGELFHVEIGAIWGANLVELIDGEGWPAEEYRSICDTIDRAISWEPEGSGRAMGIAEDGGLVVETGTGPEILYAGAVRHVRDG